MERFWRTYKHEFFPQRDPRSLEEAMEMSAEWLEYYNKERPHWRWVTGVLSCTGSLPSPRWRRIFGAIFVLRRSLRRYTPRPRCAWAAAPTLQNRSKNGLTFEVTE